MRRKYKIGRPFEIVVVLKCVLNSILRKLQFISYNQERSKQNTTPLATS